MLTLNTLARWRVPLQKMEFRCLVKRYLDKSGQVVWQFKDNLPGEKWLCSFTARHKLSVRIPDNIKPVRAKVTVLDHHHVCR